MMRNKTGLVRGSFVAICCLTGCIVGSPENETRAFLGLSPEERRYWSQQRALRQQDAARIDEYRTRISRWEAIEREQERQRCHISVAEIAQMRHEAFSVQPILDEAGAASDLPLPTLKFDDSIVRDGNCIASYILREVHAETSAPGLVVTITPPWRGPWEAGRNQSLPKVVFSGQITHYNAVTYLLAAQVGDENTTLVIEALTRDINGHVQAQVTVANQGMVDLEWIKINISIHHAIGESTANSESTIPAKRDLTLFLPLEDMATAQSHQHIARLFGYAGPATNEPINVKVHWIYRLRGEEILRSVGTRIYLNREMIR